MQWTTVDCRQILTDHSGLQWTTEDCNRLQQATVDYNGPLWIATDCNRPQWTVIDYDWVVDVQYKKPVKMTKDLPCSPL